MKNLLSLAVAGLALAAMSQPIYADREKEEFRGKGKAKAAGQAQMKIQQPSRAVTMAPQRSTQTFQAREGARVRADAGSRTFRADTGTRTVTRTSPSVAFGGQTRISGDRNRVITSDTRRFETSERRFDRRDVRFYRPPLNVYRDWDRDQIYTWNNHRWHWRDNAWIIIDAGPRYYEPSATTYVYSDSGSLAAQVQRRLAREGYDPGPIDGVIGSQTRSAIAAFQRDHDLAVTGDINSALLHELDLR